MINNNNLYSAFNMDYFQTKPKQVVSQNQSKSQTIETVEQAKVKGNDKFGNKGNKAFLALPPAIGALGGVLASINYLNNKKSEGEKSIENYRQRLELGYKTLPVCNNLRKEIRENETIVAKCEKENLNIAHGIEVIKRNAREQNKDYSSIIKNDEEIIKINETMISNKKDYIQQCKDMLANFYQKGVVELFEKQKNEINETVKKQTKNFTVAAVAIATTVGIVTSFIINKVQNNKKENKNESIAN